jgi:ferrochelatase
MQRTESFPTDLLDPNRPTGLILGGIGGPDSPAAVAAFLRNLLKDPAMIPLPRPLARLFGAWVVRNKTEEIRQRYLQIDPRGISPHLGWARQQCSQLAFRLGERGFRIQAEPAMRYWHPYADEAVQKLLAEKYRQFVVLPNIPQFTANMSGGILANITDVIHKHSPEAPIHVVPEWHLLPGYVATLAGQAEPMLRDWHAAGHAADSCAIVFSGQSLPQRFMQKGNSYLQQMRATVAAAHDQLAVKLTDLADWWPQVKGAAEPLLAFQRKVSPFCWLRPDLVNVTRNLAHSGCQHLLVVPISYSSEQIETLYELDIRLADIANRAGIADFQRTAALNLDARWLASLVDHLMTHAFAGLQAEAASD